MDAVAAHDRAHLRLTDYGWDRLEIVADAVVPRARLLMLASLQAVGAARLRSTA